MYPHERDLVEKLADRPFVIIGVNSDSDREALKRTLVEERITWRSFWDGGSTFGPIATRWHVQGWPTVWLIDAEGTLRHEGAKGNAFDRMLATLLAEAEAR